MAPSNHTHKGRGNPKQQQSKTAKRKPGRQTVGKNQLLISRFFNAKSSTSPSDLTPTPSIPILTARAKRVKPPEPAILPSSPDKVNKADRLAQPESEDSAELFAIAPARENSAKCHSPPAESALADGSTDAVLPRKRTRSFVADHTAIDDDSEDSEPPRKLLRFGKRRCRSEDPDFVVQVQSQDTSESIVEPAQKEADDWNVHQDGTDHCNSGPTPGSQRRGTALKSYEFHRSSHIEEKHLPRDAKQQRRFQQKIWPLGKRALELPWAPSSEDAMNPRESKHARQSKAKNYTPLESQFVALRKQHPDMLLVIECGYKYRMFDSDASMASKVLRIAAYFDRNFLTASFPTHRLSYHVNRLVQAGHKVGVVNQSETAALKKAGKKASGLFERKLESIYTRGTMVADGRLLQPRPGSGDGSGLRTSTYIMAILEVSQGASSSVSVCSQQIALAAVDSTTGQVVWDSFADDVLRSELVSRLTALEPVEILMSAKNSSRPTELVMKAFAHKSGSRIERMTGPSFAKLEALNKLNHAVEGQYGMYEGGLRAIPGCLGALHEYLTQFGLERFLTKATEYTSSRSNRHMSLDSDVLRNFEILGNSNNGSIQGSLFEFLNRTKTAAGSRQMRKWLCNPLVSQRDIIDRLEAVDYLRSKVDACKSESAGELVSNAVVRLISCLAGLPDLEQGFLRITCQKCTPSEFLGVIRAFEEVGSLIDGIKDLADSAMLPALLRRMFCSTPRVDEVVTDDLVSCLNRSAAADDIYHEVFLTQDLSSELCGDNELSLAFSESVKQLAAANVTIADKTKSMDVLLRKLCKDYSIPTRDWKKVAKEEFLLEVSVSEVSSIPRSWPIISQTKSVKRFRPPQATTGYDEILCAREKRDALCVQSWRAYLELFAAVASPLRVVVRTLVHLDCLAALASVANLPGYSKPEITLSDNDPAGVQAEDVRHPLAETLQSCNGYVPNDIQLCRSHDRIALVVSGPNYGGKSSFARMTALLVILAQVGSFVPARRAVLSPFDSIYARMGSMDSIGTGMSSLMVELTETSRILKDASSKSLVVIDELGRGTSTHDGTAIAYATLAHLVEKVQCVTLFITHYPLVTALQTVFPKRLGAYYMDYREDSEGLEAVHSEDFGLSDTQSARRIKITLLYKLTEGVASSSYGLNVAQIAGVPMAVIEHAKEKASGLEDKLKESKRENSLAQLLSETTWRSPQALAAALHVAATCPNGK